jgi:hypothetical protein
MKTYETRQSGVSDEFLSPLDVVAFFFIDVRRIRLRLRLIPLSLLSSNSFFLSRSLTFRRNIGLNCLAADN